ncbi:MAG: Ni/Fe hydrogenase subunit beta, partial [Candidatus Thermoplasmatota archaeon]|nr:Ni/Fe hydrogenase subunit beta [Candidatus Thermoplasmatota archaeon]
MKILSKKDFLSFIDSLIKDESMDVEGVKAKGERFVYAPLDSAEELRLDFDVTLLPPKKYFLPQYETLMQFDISKPFSVQMPPYPKKLVLVGVHPYDIIAIRQMDTYFLDSDISTAYLRRRKNTVIIGSDVMNPASKTFFGSMGTGFVNSGYDLFLTDLGDRVAVEIGTEEGARLLTSAAGLREANPIDVQKVKALRNSSNAQAMRGLK